MGAKNTSTTQDQNTAPDPTAAANYRALLSRASGVAETPYQSYTGELVAPVNAQQNLGIGTINANAQPLTAEDIQRYSNPYTQNVINATQAQFANSNAEQQQGVLGNAASLGALGGDRVGVAQAELARQQKLAQDPVIAGLYSNSYLTGLNTAQQQQQFGVNAGNAQIGAGGLQQQTQQQKDLAEYNQFQQSLAFPYQQTQWLAGVDTGVGSQLGGTSHTVTTPPPPNPLNTIAGLGLAGAGIATGNPFLAASGVGSMFGGSGGSGSPGFYGGSPSTNWALNPSLVPRNSARGGRIAGFAEGGAPVMPYGDAHSWVPMAAMAPGRGLPHGGMSQPTPQPTPGVQQMVSTASALANMMRQGSKSGVGGDGPIYRDGGIVNLPTDGRIVLPRGYDMGGMPTMAGFGSGSMIPSFANGGGDDSLNPRNWLGYEIEGPSGEKTGGTFDPPPPTPEPAEPLAYADGPPLPQRRPLAGVGELPPEITGDASIASPEPPEGPQAGFGNSGIGPALMAAGFGMMASKSPYFGVAAGEGGQHGMQTYAQQKKADLDQRRADATMARQAEQTGIQRKSVELRAKQLMQEAERHAAELAERTRQHNMPKIEKGQDEYGRPLFHLVDPVNGTIKALTPEQAQGVKGEQASMPGTAKLVQGDLPPGIKISPSDPVVDAPASAAPQRDEAFMEELNNANPKAAAVVKALVEGRIQPPTQAGMRAPYWQKMFEDASKYDPTFDATNYRARSNLRANMASGPMSQNRTSFNTVMGHIDALANDIDKLPNTGILPGVFNPLIQGYKRNTGDKEYQALEGKFRTDKTAVADELAKVFKGTGASNLHDIIEWNKTFDQANSPAALKAAVKAAVDLVKSRIDAMGDTYNTGMGTKIDPVTWLSPKARKVYDRMSDNEAPAASPKAIPSGKPQTVIQNGHTYTLQPDGSYR